MKLEKTLWDAKSEALESLIVAVGDRTTPIEYVREISAVHYDLVFAYHREVDKQMYQRREYCLKDNIGDLQ